MRRVVENATRELPLLEIALTSSRKHVENLSLLLSNSRLDKETELKKGNCRVAELCGAVAMSGSLTSASLLDDFKRCAERTANMTTNLGMQQDAYNVARVDLDMLEERIYRFKCLVSSEEWDVDLNSRGGCVVCGSHTEHGKQSCDPTHAELETVLSLQSKLSRCAYPSSLPRTPGSLERALGFNHTTPLQRWSTTDNQLIDCYLSTDQLLSTYPGKYSTVEGRRAVMLPVQNLVGTVHKHISFDSLVKDDSRFGALFQRVDNLLTAIHKLNQKQL